MNCFCGGYHCIIRMSSSSDQESDRDDTMVTRGDEKKKKKRKRNQMTDLRFENELAELDGRSKRKERKKK